MRAGTKEKLVRLICKTGLQPFMHKLYLLGLTGMNYGNASSMSYRATGEKKALHYVAAKAGNEPVLFDVGANTGSYTALLTEVLKGKAYSIFAFEPSHHTFPLLQQNTGVLPQVHIFNIGLGSKKAELTLFANYETSGAGTLYSNALSSFTHNRNISETISIETLDDFCMAHQIKKIDLLKLDVEGHELQVLVGASQMLQQKRIRFIQFEFGAFHVYSRTFFKDFWDLLSPFYTLYRIISNGLVEINAYNENLEIFRTANFLAEIRPHP